MKQTVLIADDDAELCDLYRRFLTERGYEAKTASDGLDCLRKLGEVTPTILVLDLELHWGGGAGVLACLREESLMSGISVILTATAGYPPDNGEFSAAPVADFLRKPFSLTALMESVRCAVAKKERREPANLHRVYSELFIG